MRQTVLRVMRPFTAYQETVNGQVLAGLEEVTRGWPLRDGELEA